MPPQTKITQPAAADTRAIDNSASDGGAILQRLTFEIQFQFSPRRETSHQRNQTTNKIERDTAVKACLIALFWPTRKFFLRVRQVRARATIPSVFLFPFFSFFVCFVQNVERFSCSNPATIVTYCTCMQQIALCDNSTKLQARGL